MDCQLGSLQSQMLEHHGTNNMQQDQAMEFMRQRNLVTFSLCIMANKLELHEILEVRK